jgi:hypothetical protein
MFPLLSARWQHPLTDALVVQSELAHMFGKSRMTICRLLRPASVAKIKALVNSGVRMEAKRCKPPQYPEVERRLYQDLGLGSRPVSKAEIVARAEQLAHALNIPDMDTSYNWCLRFINQHNLTVGSA